MEVRISVRNLVEFILRNGDIDNRKAAVSENAMTEGTRIHRMIQKSMGTDYHAEVPLSYSYPAGAYNILVEGRADGIIGNTEEMTPEELLVHPITIDEIKGTYRDVYRMTEPVLVHLAQAKCYAYIYTKQNDLPKIRVRMTYCNLDNSDDIQYFYQVYTKEEIENWFCEIMESYRKWADFTFEWSNLRKDSIKNMEFPFPYRQGQKELVGHVYRTIYHNKKLFIEAPTGVGKTISTVFPAVKAVGEGLAERIFYLTAKTITRTVAQEAFEHLRENGLRFKTVILTAKEKICFEEETDCNPVSCPYAKGHYDRINDAIYDLLISEESFDRDKIEEYALKHQVCPFEMCLDMSLFSDAIICDYNYVFDPHVYLRRFFAEGVQRDYLFLIDEAHNLVDRGREMYSAILVKEDFLELKKTVKIYDKKMSNLLEKCNRELLLLKKECENYQILDQINTFIIQLERLSSVMEKYLEDHDDSPVRNEVLDFYFEVSHFLGIYDKVDDNYVMYTEMESDGSFILKLFCVNPSENLKECMARGRSSILFSATLLPIQYYKGLLGGESDDFEVYAESVFQSDHRALLIGSEVTSKYTRRNQNEFYQIATYIHEITGRKPGNYMVFCPSHVFLKQVLDAYQEYFNEEQVEILIQEDYMDEKAREDFLERFSVDNQLDFSELIQMPVEIEKHTLLGFCVMGGIFAEGIDLKNDSLIGAIIIGTGIPQVCNELEIVKNYFDVREGDGFDYAYRYPGMNKVLQASGRVIRTSEDLGVIALLDERFLSSSYQKMFPREWEHFYVVTNKTVGIRIEEFWNRWDNLNSNKDS